MVIVWLAPPEKTMGYGIRPVYVHVALIWTGMLGLLMAGLLGLVLTVTNQAKWGGWMQTVGWVSFGFILASLVASIVAQIVNWNGIFWDEPRNQMIVRLVVAYLAVLIANSWLPWPRLRGLVMVVSAGVMLSALRFTPNVLHPEDPIGNSSASGIQVTFLVLGLLSVVAATWIVMFLGRRLPATNTRA
jgi:hypothetical protein